MSNYSLSLSSSMIMMIMMMVNEANWWKLYKNIVSFHPPTVLQYCGQCLQSRQWCLLHQESRMQSLRCGLNQSRPHLWKNMNIILLYLNAIPGTVSAVSCAALPQPPSSTMESGREGGVQAVWEDLATLWLCLIRMMIALIITDIFVEFDKYWIGSKSN